MPKENQEYLQPNFADWTIREVKDSALQALLNGLKRSGFRGLTVLLVILSLGYLGTQVVASNMEGANKAYCVLGIVSASLALGLAALLTEKADYAAAEQTGRDGEGEPGTVPGDEGAGGAPPGGDRRALDGRGHQSRAGCVRDSCDGERSGE